MKKKIVAIVLASLMLFSMTGCQSVARNFGGTVETNLPKGQKLVNVTWKENSLWYLTKPMTKEDSAETYEFIQDSNFGIIEGKVIIHEVK